MKFFKENFGIKKFKNADTLGRECVSLPIDPMLTTKEVNYIIKTVNKF